MPKNAILSRYVEGKLNFDPTYKYDKNCEVYDTSPKQRIPAWCDRVLFTRDPQFKSQLIEDPAQGDDAKASFPAYYNRQESYFSDHRPVLAVYHLPIIKINSTNKEQLRQQILNNIMGTAGRVSKQSLHQNSQLI